MGRINRSDYSKFMNPRNIGPNRKVNWNPIVINIEKEKEKIFENLQDLIQLRIKLSK